MRKLLNTLYVTSQGGYLTREGDTILISNEDSGKLRLPVLNLEGVVCFGNVAVSSSALGLCAEQQIGLSFLTENGRFVARTLGRVHGNVLLRRAHYRLADNPKGSRDLAVSFVVGKMANARRVLQRFNRERDAPLDTVSAVVDALGQSLFYAEKATCVDELRGIEGDAARAYFGVFNDLILRPTEEFRFAGRSRRPPLDRVNALLSFVYTLLTHDVRSALESVGLDPCVGFLHADRPGRPSLALDVMEELRPVVGDRLVLSLINREQVKPTGFSVTESGAVEMSPETRKEVISAYQKRKRDEIEHPFLKEKIELGLLPFAQALLLARHIRGDLNAYPAFLWR